MKPSAILESALYVDNLGAADVFYAQVMGMERISAVEGRHVFFRCGSGVLLLFNAEATRIAPPSGARFPIPAHGAIGQGHLCFAATRAEIDAWKSRLQAADIRIEADFEWPGGGRSIYFRDPSGNSIEFAEPQIWDL